MLRPANHLPEVDVGLRVGERTAVEGVAEKAVEKVGVDPGEPSEEEAGTKTDRWFDEQGARADELEDEVE